MALACSLPTMMSRGILAAPVLAFRQFLPHGQNGRFVLAACTGAAVTLGLLAHQLVRWWRDQLALLASVTPDEVIDMQSRVFAARACRMLQAQGFARVRLTSEAALCSEQLLEDAAAFFADADATRRMHIAPKDRSTLDARNGYVCECGRECMCMNYSSVVFSNAVRNQAATE